MTRHGFACRKVIAAETARLTTTALALVDRCHAARARGKTAADCNLLAEADPKGKLAKTENRPSVTRAPGNAPRRASPSRS